MNSIGALVTCLFLVLGITTAQDGDWESFKEKYNKSYDGTEENARKSIFEANVQYIKENTNRGNYNIGITQFADMTEREMYEENYVNRDEVLVSLVFVRMRDYHRGDHTSFNQSTVTPPLEPSVSSPLASLASLVMEAHFYLTEKKVGEFSSQQLIDCSEPDQPLPKAFDLFVYISRNGLEDRKSYPFSQSKGKCKFDQSKVVVGNKGTTVPQTGEDVLQKIVKTNGPVLAAINATPKDLRFYQSGIYDGYCPNTTLTTWVAVFGYGSDAGHDYWLVRPNWGTSFGESGFIRIARNNVYQCGLGIYSVYPSQIYGPHPKTTQKA